MIGKTDGFLWYMFLVTLVSTCFSSYRVISPLILGRTVLHTCCQLRDIVLSMSSPTFATNSYINYRKLGLISTGAYSTRAEKWVPKSEGCLFARPRPSKSSRAVNDTWPKTIVDKDRVDLAALLLLKISSVILLESILPGLQVGTSFKAQQTD